MPINTSIGECFMCLSTIYNNHTVHWLNCAPYLSANVLYQFLIQKAILISHPDYIDPHKQPEKLIMGEKMAIGRLESSKGLDVAQGCVIVRLQCMDRETVPPNEQLYGLLTAVPLFNDQWKLVLGKNESDIYELSRNKIISWFSYCTAQNGDQIMPGWTVAILQPEFIGEIQQGNQYSFPLATPFRQEQGEIYKYCVCERDQNRSLVQHLICIDQPEKLKNETGSFEFVIISSKAVFGAPIFCFNVLTGEFHLIGIYSICKCTKSLEKCQCQCHYGVAVPYILDSAIKGKSHHMQHAA